MDRDNKFGDWDNRGAGRKGQVEQGGARTSQHQGKKVKKLTTKPLAEVGGYENPRGLCFVGREAGDWR
jgi:hypothetical protein